MCLSFTRRIILPMKCFNKTLFAISTRWAGLSLQLMNGILRRALALQIELHRCPTAVPPHALNMSLVTLFSFNYFEVPFYAMLS